jgi:hypothetical protein
MKTTNFWFCDSCGERIEKVEDGWVEWITYPDKKGKDKTRNFRLVHKQSSCQFNEKDEYKKDKGIVADVPLKSFLGVDGLTYLLSKIAINEIPTEEVLEMIKRLHVPGYEATRRHADRALRMGVIEQDNYPGYYSQNQIKTILDQKWPDDFSKVRAKKPSLNMKKGFSENDLCQLLSSCDDLEGHHIIWVDNNGNVDIALLPKKLTPAGWANSMKDKIKFRYETLVSGNGYVGFEAAKDKKYVKELYKDLMKDWGKNRTGYIDYSE